MLTTTPLIHFSVKRWENLRFELGSERVKTQGIVFMTWKTHFWARERQASSQKRVIVPRPYGSASRRRLMSRCICWIRASEASGKNRKRIKWTQDSNGHFHLQTRQMRSRLSRRWIDQSIWRCAAILEILLQGPHVASLKLSYTMLTLLLFVLYQLPQRRYRPVPLTPVRPRTALQSGGVRVYRRKPVRFHSLRCKSLQRHRPQLRVYQGVSST